MQVCMKWSQGQESNLLSDVYETPASPAMLPRQMEFRVGCAPTYHAYKASASLSMLTEHKLVVPLGNAPRHGSNLER